MITGRRASQGAERALLQPLEVDSTGLLKLNPLFAWSFAQIDQYIKENNVPRNKLLNQGYRSVGDWHSTSKSGEGDAGERAGRWAGKQGKTECGLHKDYCDIQRKAKVGIFFSDKITTSSEMGSTVGFRFGESRSTGRIRQVQNKVESAHSWARLLSSLCPDKIHSIVHN